MRKILLRKCRTKNEYLSAVVEADSLFTNDKHSDENPSNAVYNDIMRGAVRFNGKSYHLTPIDEIKRLVGCYVRRSSFLKDIRVNLSVTLA